MCDIGEALHGVNWIKPLAAELTIEESELRLMFLRRKPIPDDAVSQDVCAFS
jgi:hypothetical protein